jgi:hypothetical protein
MADDDPRPDHTEDPRKQEQASEGYPETAPAGTDGDSSRRLEEDTASGDAPSPSTDKEADRDHSTGNPDVAG